jgi:hypothetical protein
MKLSSEDVDVIVGSIGNFFKSLVSSFKLLGHTLVLNLNVIQASFSNDRKKIGEAFENFAVGRRKYDEETKENLTHFRKFYEMEGIEGLGGFGPKFLTFAANPLLFASTHRSAKLSSPDGEKYIPPEISGYQSKLRRSADAEADGPESIDTGKPSTRKPSTRDEKSFPITPRVQRALDFFGYRYSSSLSEQKAAAGVIDQPAPAPTKKAQVVPPEVQREIGKMQSIAQKYVEDEQKRAGEILQIVSGRVAIVKKVIEAKNFDELLDAMSGASSAGLKLYDSNIKSVRQKITSDLQKQQKEDPVKFKAAVAELRKQAPDVAESDDLKAAETIMLGASKSQIQGKLINSYDSIFNDASKVMGLPISPQDRAGLEKTEIGKRYLAVLDDFDRKLQTGQATLQGAKSKIT